MANIKEIDGNIQTVSERILHYAIHVILALLSISCLYPFLLIVGSSFQTQQEIITKGYAILPKMFSVEAYKMIMSAPKALIDSYNITIVSTVLGTLIGLWMVSTYSYALSRRDYRYRKILAFYVFFTMLFSGGLVPTYILLTKWLMLKNTILVLIIPGLCTGWNILMMKGFFQSIPESLIESAKIDGASELRIFSTIILPISKPAFATIGLFYVLAYWNDWYSSLLYIDKDSMVKLQYLLMKILRNAEFLNSADALKYGVAGSSADVPTLSARMAMCVLAAGPILIVFPFFQKYFVKGLTVGAVKG